MLKPERAILEKLREFETPAAAFEWLVEKTIVDHKRCRVWAIKNHYAKLTRQGMAKMDAITHTSIEYCVSEATVQEALYRYKDI